MGMAYSSIANDAFGMFFNPAGTANAPLPEMGTSIGRMPDPTGNLSWWDMSYIRPYPSIHSATVGFSYDGQWQTENLYEQDFLFNYAQDIDLSKYHLSKPLQVGGNFKVLDTAVAPGAGGTAALGFDGGVLARSDFGWNSGMSLLNLTTDPGFPHPTFIWGNSYDYDHWLTAAVDLHIRPGLTAFYPGLEASFDQGLLDARIGKGLPLEGVNQLAFGFGVDFSPFVLDAASTFPTGGVYRSGGGYQMSLSYRFGAPTYEAKFVGEAAREADELVARIQALQAQKNDLELKLGRTRTDSEAASGQLSVLEARIKELEARYKALTQAIERTNFDLQSLRNRKAALLLPSGPGPKIPTLPKKAAPAWPKKHVVVEGDTLRSLAKKYYGDETLWERIYDANPDAIDRGLPHLGSVLTIPAPRKPSPTGRETQGGGDGGP